MNNIIMNMQNQSQDAMTSFMTSLLGGLMNGNPHINNIAKDANFWNTLYSPNMNNNDIQNQINMIDSILKNLPGMVPNDKGTEPVTPEKSNTEPVVPDAPVKVQGTEIRSELPVATARKLNFDVDSGLSIDTLKDAIFSMVLLTMEKDNVDWTGKRGSGLPNAPGYNIIDASKRYYTGNRVEKIDQFVRENIIKNEDTFGQFLNKLNGQLIAE